MKKRILSSMIAIFAVLLIISGCTSTPTASPTKEKEEASKQASTERVIKHDMGETTLKSVPQKIVVLEYSFLDALVTLGQKPVGVADDGDSKNLIPPVKEKLGDYTSVGSRYDVNFELVSSTKPDLIIADSLKHKEVYGKLNAIAPTIALKSQGSTYEENLNSFLVIADAINKKEKGDEILKTHRANMAELKKKIPQNETRTELPAVVTAKGFFGHSSHAYAASVLESLGIKPALLFNGDNAYPSLTIEQLIETNPDIMFLMVDEGATILDEWKTNPLWSKINAVKNNQVFNVGRAEWSYSRGIISAENIAKQAIDIMYKK